MNARDAMPEGGLIQVRTTVETIQELPKENTENESVLYAKDMVFGKYVCLSVKDNGEGMSPEVRRRIFDPFFTTKPIGKGTGLGLATLFGFVSEGGGFIWVESLLGVGTEFRIFLPIVEVYESEPQTTLGPVAPFTYSGRTALVVEDDPDLRSFVCTILAKAGFETIESPDGLVALQLAQERPNQIHIMITDQFMPGVKGKTLIRILHQHYPDLRCILMSGSISTAELTEMAGPLTVGLAKPFLAEDLLLKIETLFRPTTDF